MNLEIRVGLWYNLILDKYCAVPAALKGRIKKVMINIAVIGFGIVGSGVYEVINKNLPRIAMFTSGEGLNIKHILDLRTFPGHPLESAVTADYNKILSDDSVRVIIETMGGTEPAFDYSMRALRAGKHVVTSNKAVVEAHGRELIHTAKDNGVYYLYEASVGGGIPVISTLHSSFGSNTPGRVAGILNGTTNFILSKMKNDGLAFDEALSLAKELGFAERDPSADVDGFDTARKICILTALCRGVYAGLGDCAVIEEIGRASCRERV